MLNDNSKNNFINWHEVDDMIKVVSKQILHDKFEPVFVAPIPKGGWTVASLLAQHLNVKKSISLSQDKSGDFRRTYIAGYPDIKGKKVLVIEDSIETGKSLFNAKSELINLGAEVKTATLFVSSSFKDELPDYYFAIGEIPIFPWEILY